MMDKPKPDPVKTRDGDDSAAILEEARERMSYADSIWADQYQASRREREFVAGAQWLSEDVQARNAQGSSCLVLNNLPTFIAQVTGDQRLSRPSIQVQPSDGFEESFVLEDEGKEIRVSEVMEGLIRQIEYDSHAPLHYDMAAEDAAEGGIGWLRVITEYDQGATWDQVIRIRRIDNWDSVYVDPMAQDPLLSDADYAFVQCEMPRKAFEELYPDATPGALGARERAGRDEREGAVAVTEYFRREAVKRTLLRLDNGDVVFLDQIGGRDGVERLAQAGVQIMGERQHYGQKVIWTKISGSHVLEGDTEFPASVIPLVPVFGRRAYHDRRVLYHGLTYHAHDAQRMKNFWMSAATDRLGRQPAQPIMVTPTMIEGFEEFYRNLNRPSPYLPYNPDPEAPAGRPTREPTPQMPVAELQTALTMEEMVKSTVGIHDAGLGARSNETSGRAIMARQRESDVGTSLYLSNRDAAVGQIGRIVMEMIPRVYDSTRVVPVRRPDSSVQRVRLNAITQDDSGNDIVVNDLSQARLSCVVKSGPGFTTMREEAREALMGIQATDPEAGRLILDQIVRNSDWPGADPIADRFSQAYVPPHMQSAEDRENMPEPQPDPAQQAEAMKAQAEMAKAQADQARAQAEMMKAEAEMAQVQAGAEGAMSPEQVQQMVAAAVAEAVAAMRGEAQ